MHLPWFSEEQKRPSARNGTIFMRRYLGAWNVSVNECGQTSPYTHQMWTEAFEKIFLHVAGNAEKRILMLGLGAGGEISTLHNIFPRCTITAIEYDEEMVRIARQLHLYGSYPFPHVIIEDAAQAVKALRGPYDLIMEDLFVGAEPTSLLLETDFLKDLRRLLSTDGIMVINVNKRPEYLDQAAHFFQEIDRWSFQENHLGAFTPRPGID